MEENEVGNPNELGMDLDLNVGLPSPPHLISYLGLGLEPEQETPFHVISPSHWFSQIPSAGGHDSEAAARRGHLTVEEGSSSGGARLVVNSEGEGRSSRSSHARHRWRRREMRRIRPTVLDLPGPYSSRGSRAGGSMGHLLIFSPVDGGVGASGGEAGTITGNAGGASAAAETAPGTQKPDPKRLLAEALADETEEQREASTSNFECNVCLEVAKEPVVTSCGHLFCWPCLYQWIHVHSNSMECPVCKGEVTDMNITPIYGRGSTSSDSGKAVQEDLGSGLKVPPRPHGCRIESLRQRIYRSTSRRMDRFAGLREYLGLRAAEMGDRERPPVAEEGTEDLFEGLHAVTDRILSMVRVAQRLDRENLDGRSQSGRRGLFRNSAEFRLNPPETRADSRGDRLNIEEISGRLRGRSFLREGGDHWHVFSSRMQRSDRLAALSARLASVEGMLQRFAQTASGPANSGPSAPMNVNSSPSVDNQGAPQSSGPALAEDRTSISSTAGTIQPDSLAGDVSAEPASVGSSSHTRRRRNGASGSSDVDGGAAYASKRRRLN
ncbi:uncharacterized protein LOC116259436 [Nymphaea colorata]|uniref:E3 ubiquitin-protein ligase RMA n=1 Tax=Nymphaea colorata TaxID=210225 RepID=A0A5K1FWL0_9MAGN|nr:uncharacterized protein LOC116259436 [Nymphaea colorata]